MRVAIVVLALVPSVVAAQDSARVVPSRHKSAVSTVALSADGRRVASASDSTVIVWDLASGDSVAGFRVPSIINEISFSPDANRIGVVAFGAAILSDLNGKLSQFSLQGSAGALAFSPNGSAVAVAAANDRMVWIVDASTLRVTSTLRGHGGERIQLVRFDATGSRLLVVSGDPNQDFLRLWDTQTWRSIWNARTTAIVDARFTGHDTIVVAERSAGPRRRSLIVTRPASSGAATRSLDIPAEVSIDGLSPDARMGVMLQSDVTLVDLSSGAQVRKLPVAPRFCGDARPGGLLRTTFSADGRLIAAWSEFAGFTVWNVTTGQRTLAIEHATAPEVPVFEWAFVQSTHLGPDARIQERFLQVELELRNTSRERQSLDKWDWITCLWLGDKPHLSRGGLPLVNMETADSVSQRLRSGLKEGETMGVELTVAPGVTVSRMLARTDFGSSRWSWFIDPGKTVRIGARFPLSVSGSGATELEAAGVRKAVSLPSR